MRQLLGSPLPADGIASLATLSARDAPKFVAAPPARRRAASVDLLRELAGGASTQAYHPPGLDFRVRPRQIERAAHPHRTRVLDGTWPGDPRFAFFDPVYPWSAFGRVTTGQFPAGSEIAATGVMVGPRHLLTSSRIVGWHPGAPTDWLVFTPSCSNGSAPFGTAYATEVYAWRDLEYLTYDSRHDLLANDYAVVVLDHPIGESTGWIGSTTYNPAWNGQKVWDFIGYSSDFGSGQEPVFQGGVSIDSVETPAGSEPPSNALLMRYTAWTGAFPEYENGGPIFGWWSGESFPRVVAVETVFAPRMPKDVPPQSDYRYACGGLPMVALIIQALNEHP